MALGMGLGPALAPSRASDVDPDQAILDLFANGEVGFWVDLYDNSTLFQDSAGTIPVTDFGQTVGCIIDKSGSGNAMRQPTGTRRPVLNVDAQGSRYLLHDGIDDFFILDTVLNIMGGFGAWGISAAGPGIGGIASLLSSQGGGYLGYTSTTFWMKNSGGTNPTSIAMKSRQSVSVSNSTDGLTANYSDSVGNSAPAVSASNGVNAVKIIGRFNEASSSAPINCRLHGLVLRVGATTPEQRAAVRAYYARKLVSVTP